jgi:hypothetical protein
MFVKFLCDKYVCIREKLSKPPISPCQICVTFYIAHVFSLEPLGNVAKKQCGYVLTLLKQTSQPPNT